MAQAERGHVAYKKEVTWGLPDGVATRILHSTSEGIIQNIEEILSKASRGIVDEPHSYQGLKTFGGPIAFEVHPINFGDFLRSAVWKPAITAAGAAIVLLHNCDHKWNAHASCFCEKDTIDKKEGDASVKIIMPEEVTATDKVATIDFQILNRTDISFHDNGAGEEDTIETVAGNFLAAAFSVGKTIIIAGSTSNNITTTILSVTEKVINIGTGLLTEEVAGDTVTITSVIDMEADDQVKFWIKCSIDTALGNFRFLIAEDTACTTPDKEIDIPAGTANVWQEVTLTLGDMSGLNDILSIGLEMKDDIAECTVWIDNIRRIDTALAAGTAKDHTFTPSQDDFEDADTVKRCPLYPYTFEVHRDNAVDEAWQFEGCVINTLNLKFGVDDKILNGVAGILAREANIITREVIAFPTTAPFTWGQALVQLGDALPTNTYLESMELNIDNKIVGIPSLNQSYFIRRFYRSGPRVITCNFVTDFVDRVEYAKFVLGTEQKLKIIFTGAAVVGDAAYSYTLTIYMPKFRYLTYPITTPESGRISVGVTGKAKYCETVDYAIQFILRNELASYEA